LSPNMDSLIAIGSSAAVIYGIYALFAVGYFLGRGQSQNAIHYLHNLYFESAAMILTLITLGKYLEEKSKGKTSEAVKKLIDLAPKTATIIENGQELTVPADTLKNGDIIIVKQGESIPADGVIIEGYGEIDQSSLTGESLPVSKKEGDKVSAATINKAGWFKFKATATGKQTGFSGVIKLVEEALISKAPIAKLADKISGIFSYIVIAIAIITLITWILIGKDFEFALNLAISVLVISCPCALGLATPVAIMVSTGVGANLGILIKSASVLETAHKVSTVLMDKTGTITHGTPRI
ncbi:MAG: HAD-IC family P-type ATPase, partial [Oscillospiraceae bacterium]